MTATVITYRTRSAIREIGKVLGMAPEADLIVNFRIQTSSISKGRNKEIGTVEVFAYGTAIRYCR